MKLTDKSEESLKDINNILAENAKNSPSHDQASKTKSSKPEEAIVAADNKNTSKDEQVVDSKN